MDLSWRQLCKVRIEKGDLFGLSWARVPQVRRKYLFRVANVWWRWPQHCIIASCG